MESRTLETGEQQREVFSDDPQRRRSEVARLLCTSCVALPCAILLWVALGTSGDLPQADRPSLNWVFLSTEEAADAATRWAAESALAAQALDARTSQTSRSSRPTTARTTRSTPTSTQAAAEVSRAASTTLATTVATTEAPARRGTVIVTQSGLPTLERSKLMESSPHSWTKRMGPDDWHVHIVDEADLQAASAALKHVIAVPNSVIPMATCRHPNGNPCSPYETSSIKLPWALVSLLGGGLREAGRPRPLWWLLKDDDTYVHVPNLRSLEARYDPSKPLLLAHLAGGCPGICGAGGALLSWALAEELAERHGQEWIDRQVNEIRSGNFYWDVHIRGVVSWVPQAQIVASPEIFGNGPFDAMCVTPGGAWPADWPCVASPVCACAKVERVATWHVQARLEEAIAKLDDPAP